MIKFFAERSKALLISAFIGLFYLIYIIVYFYSGIVASTSGAELLGTSFATALVTPHILFTGVGVIFNFVAFALKKRWAAIVALVTYFVGAIMFLLYFIFILPCIILSGVGIATQAKINKKYLENSVVLDFKKEAVLLSISTLIILLFGTVYIVAANSSVNKKENGSSNATSALGTSNNSNDTATSSENYLISDNNKEKVYTLGETVTFKDKNGKDMYQLTINSAKLTDDRNQFCDKNVAQVFILDYTYKNLSMKDDLYISDYDFKVSDEEGNMCDTYPVSIDRNYPKNTPSGSKCTAQSAFATVAKSNKVTIIFEKHIYFSSNNEKAKFEIELN